MKRSPKDCWEVVEPQFDVEQKTHSLGEQTNHTLQLSLEVRQLSHVAPKAQSLELCAQLFAGVEIPSESWAPLPGDSSHGSPRVAENCGDQCYLR